MTLSIIVAAAENNIIGRNNNLIWHLSADLKRFKALTTGHPVIMGRKTFESIGKALPNRRNIVVTRNAAYHAEGCECTESIEEALKLVGNEGEVFVIGGGILYNSLWELADKIYLTRVHIITEGDVCIPALELSKWKEVARSDFNADERNEFAYSFIDYVKI